ncbi:MAG: DUF4157 domain-containing protein [Oscillochloridaceae bacterium]|nr:DUF4157 domain-containing protein [Chloroflexaceae bacterium]MDW8391690.1 DUF4157 domain-containing protein [Oscillochloridaceae bacterium]
MKSQLQRQPATKPAAEPAPRSLLQRKCACGGTPGFDGECATCRAKRLQRRATEGAGPSGVPPIVHEVLRSPGQPLDAETRSFMEPRFGHDFSRVRVHTGARAAESARAVNALAYTVGRDVVFGEGQYAPGTGAGRRLLAHELTHVIQQGHRTSGLTKVSEPGEPVEREADRTAEEALRTAQPGIQPVTSGRTDTIWRTRSTRSTSCPANTNSAPVDPAAVLDGDDGRAREIATTVADLTGAKPPAPDTVDIYRARFGSPPAVRTGFLNRLTGQVRQSEDVAVSEELNILSRRFRLVARFFSQSIAYRCIGGASSFGGCSPPTCENMFAWSCRGIGAIFLCPSYWDHTANTDERAAVLVHEAFHVNFGVSNPRQVGEVGDETLRGPGRNFVVADCYSGFAADLVGIKNPADSCPAAP